MTTISINEIESTKAFQSLNAIQKSFAVKRKNREILTNALIVHRNSGVVPGNVSGYNLLIVEEMVLGESAKFESDKGLKSQIDEMELKAETIECDGLKLISEMYKEFDKSTLKNNESAN